MYVVDALDEVVKLKGAPPSAIGAPLPLLVCDEGHLLLAYLIREPDPAWDGSCTTAVTPESDGAVALIRFRWPSAHMFGPPNDEAFSGHPLASRGLGPYAVYEIKQSSWIRRLERMNSVHPRHDKERFLSRRRHFVFAFHDSTFECVAERFEAETFRGAMRSAAERMVSLLREKPA